MNGVLNHDLATKIRSNDVLAKASMNESNVTVTDSVNGNSVSRPESTTAGLCLIFESLKFWKNL
jgi:hypothetical protein